MSSSFSPSDREHTRTHGTGERAKTVQRECILVVDDDAGARSALEALLRAEGYATVTAVDGEAALAEARRSPPAAVLTDLQMPLMGGVELCQRLHEVDPELPVIIMTAHVDMQPVIESLRAGAEDYLLKPLLYDAVVWCVQRALARRAAKLAQERMQRTLNEHLVLSSIREQEHAEAEALQRAQLNALLENLSEGVAVAEPGGRIVMINRTARAILGFWDDTLTIDALHSLEARDLQGRRLTGDERPLSRALAGEQFSGYEVVRIRPDGEQRRVVSTGSCVKGADGNVALAIVVFRDVTELRRLELQRDEHLALISHDLRNPLNSLLMSLSLLKGSAQREGAEGLTPARRLSVVERAERNVLRMSSMLEELTETTQLELQGVALRWAACDLREIVTGAIESLDDARARRITIEADVVSTYIVLGDAPRLERVVANLLTNALKYSADDAPVTARLELEGNSVVFEVVDRGIGIAPESRSKLFERYYRTIGGKAHAGGLGLGLGLYISRLIVEGHGGTITVSSELARGSTFRMMLPAPSKP
jgi:PAS domain S-box-containing protein